MSEELEHSLQQAVETYLNDRLRAIDEQIARLQTELSEGLNRLREHSTTQDLEGTAVSAAIFAHLQTARSERLSGVPAPTSAPAETAGLKNAVEQIEAQQSQADVLKALLQGAKHYADRAALFVIKNDQAIGWRLAKSNDPDLEMIGGVSLPLSAQTIVTRAVRDRVTASGADAADADYAMLLDQLGGAPAVVMASPLIVRGKVVAVLYADSPSTDSNAMNGDALELLARVASMAVNLVSIQRTAPSPAATAETSQPAAAPVPPTVYAPQVEPAEPAAEEHPAEATEVPKFETAETEVESPSAPEISADAAPQVEADEHAPEPSEPAAPTVAEPAWEMGSVAPAESVAEPELAPAYGTEPVTAAPAPEPQSDVAQTVTTQPLAPPPPPEPAPVFSSQYSTPLGTSRRSGVSEPELPVEVGEDERRLHNDARRFARLLVSEIKLYNEP